jgi:hypothetical protein
MSRKRMRAGYSATGRAWRFEIPVELCGQASIDMLKFITLIIGPAMDMIESTLPTAIPAGRVSASFKSS